MEFIGDPDTGEAAPRLVQLRPEPPLLAELWEQLVTAMSLLARLGLTHGDLSPYNLLLHGERLVMIDLPQVVDVVANPRGRDLLACSSPYPYRQCRATWAAPEVHMHSTTISPTQIATYDVRCTIT